MEDKPIKTLQDIIASREIIWLGLDFTRVKLIGPDGFSNVHEIVHTYFYSINDLWVREPNKFNFAKYMGKFPRYMLDTVHKRNINIPMEGLVQFSDPPDRIDGTIVQQVVDDCRFPKEDLIGLMFIVETMNKPMGNSLAWVTFIDLNTGKVILTNKYSGRAMGFGFRNFWANSFHDILRRLPSLVR